MRVRKKYWAEKKRLGPLNRDVIKVKFQIKKEKYEINKIGVMAVLLAVACFLTYYFHVILGICTIFSHFFYIPVILACSWWKRKGLVVAVFLAVMLLLSHHIFAGEVGLDDYFRAFMFIVIGIVVVLLSERLAESEKALRVSEEKYRTIASSVNDVIFTLDLEGKFTFISPRGPALSGYAVDEIIGHHFTEFLAEEHREPTIEKIQGGEIPFHEVEIVTKNGRRIPVELNVTCIFDKDGEVTGRIGVFRDITERKKAEKELQESEERYRLIAENTSDIISLTTFEMNPKYTYVSASCRALGYEPEEAIGKSVFDFMHPDDKKRLLPLLKKYVIAKAKKIFTGKETSVSEIIEHRLRDKRGNWHYMETTGNIVGDQMLFVTRDITERKKAEEETRQAYGELDQIFQTAADGMRVVDKDFNMFRVNETFSNLVGMDKDEVVGKKCYDVFPGPLCHTTGCPLTRIMEGEDRVEVEVGKEHLDGKKIPCIVTATPFKGLDGELIGIVEDYKDITERKQAEDQITRSLEEKEMLLREIHHRVKNNMQIINSLLNLQSKYLDGERELDILQECQNRVKSMAMIHEKLYQSRDLARIDFTEYIQSLASGLFSSYGADPSLIKLNMTLEGVSLNIETAIPCGLMINELLSNCLKHAFPGGRKGEINIDFHREDEKMLVLTVSDNGVGLPEDLDIKDTETMGLQLVNALTGQLDGTIELDTTHGTEFKITFRELEYKERI